MLGAVRGAVRRPRADAHLRLLLVAFVVSVLGTRLYLDLADYPQVGGEVLHIAHALWGGLLLVVASVLPLVVANRWVYPVAALLAGAGTGLFVDEVGKFITQDNDYFYPAAAPIVYTTFLLTALVWLQVRRPRELDARAELYAAFEEMEDVLDHDLEPEEREALDARLDRVLRTADSADLRRLAEALQEFLRSQASVVPSRPGWTGRVSAWWDGVVERHGTEPRLRAAVVVGLGGLGALALSDLVAVAALTAGELVERLARIEVGEGAAPVLLARVVADAAIGVVLVASAVAVATGRHRRGALRLATYGLLAALTVVNLVVFYFDQFLASVGAIAQFTVLGLVAAYERRHVRGPDRTAGREPGSRPAAGSVRV